MKNIKIKAFEKDGYILRLATLADAEEYYKRNYDPLDKDVARLTGCKEHFTKDEVISFFVDTLDDNDRYHFLIVAPDGKIIGESVINEIDEKVKSANFRICIFRSDERNKGIGTWAIEATRDFSFETLKLHRLSLDVFSFNTRAEKAYLNAGFRKEGVLRDAISDGDKYADDILMSMLYDEWLEIKQKENS